MLPRNKMMVGLLLGVFFVFTAGLVSGSSIAKIQPADEESPPTYCSSTNGTIATGTGAGTVTSIAYLWHPASVTKRYQIRLASYSGVGGAGTGKYMLRVSYITAENAVPGGTSQPIHAIDDGPATAATFRTGATGAPTRVAGDVRTYSFGATTPATVAYSAPLGMRPFTILASVNQGIEVRTEVTDALSQDAFVTLFICWTEV